MWVSAMKWTLTVGSGDIFSVISAESLFLIGSGGFFLVRIFDG